MGFECTSRTHVGHKRKLNEDALLSLAEERIWAVADGMGGHDAGEVASAMVVDALNSLAPASSLTNKAGKAIGALEVVNAALIDLAQSTGLDRTIGTTVVGLIADGEEYCCFWVGDSRAYRIRNGKLTRLTRDHSLVQDLVEAGMLEAERADDHPNANILTRAVGASSQLNVDTITGNLETGDLFILASDGLTRMIGDDELLATLTSKSLEHAADDLLDMTLTRGAPDNVSFVIVKSD